MGERRAQRLRVRAACLFAIVLLAAGCGSVPRGYSALEDGDLERAMRLAERAERREEPGEALLRAEVALAQDDTESTRAALDDAPNGRERLLLELRLAERSEDAGAWTAAWIEAHQSGITVPTPGADWAEQVIRPLLSADVNALAGLVSTIRAEGAYAEGVRETVESAVDVLLYRLLAGGGALEARATLRVLEPAMPGTFVIEKHRAAQTMTRSPERTNEVFAPLAATSEAGVALAVEFAQRGAHGAAVEAWQWLIERSDAPPSGWLRRAAESAYVQGDRERARAFANDAFAGAEDFDEFSLVADAVWEAGDPDWAAPAIADLAAAPCDASLPVDMQEVRAAAGMFTIAEAAFVGRLDEAASMAQARIDAGCAPVLVAGEAGLLFLELDPVFARRFLEEALTMEPLAPTLVQPYLESTRLAGGSDQGDAVVTAVVDAFEAQPDALDSAAARALAETLIYHGFVVGKPTLNALAERVYVLRVEHAPEDWETTVALVRLLAERDAWDDAFARLRSHAAAVPSSGDGWVDVGRWLEGNVVVGRTLAGRWYVACGTAPGPEPETADTADMPLEAYCWFRAAERFAANNALAEALDATERFRVAIPDAETRWRRIFGSAFIPQRLPASHVARLAHEAESEGQLTGEVAFYAGRAALGLGERSDAVEHFVRAIELDSDRAPDVLDVLDDPQTGGELVAVLVRLGEGHGARVARARGDTFVELATRSDRTRREGYLAMADAAYREFLAEGGRLTALVPEQLRSAGLHALAADAFAAALDEEPGNLGYILGEAWATVQSDAGDDAAARALDAWMAAMDGQAAESDAYPGLLDGVETLGEALMLQRRRAPQLAVNLYQWALDRAATAAEAETFATGLVEASIDAEDFASARQVIHAYFVVPARQIQTPFGVRPPMYQDGTRTQVALRLLRFALSLYGDVESWALAEEIGREVLALDPSQRNLIPTLIAVALRARGVALSFDTVAAIVSEAGGEPAAWALAAEALEASRAEFALRAWDRAVALSPEDANLHTGRVHALVRLGRIDEAFTAASANISEADESVWRQRMFIFREIDRPDLADALTALRPASRSATLEHAYYQDAHGDTQRARRMFEGDGVPRADLVSYLLRNGHTTEGLALWVREAARIPSDQARQLYSRFGNTVAGQLPRTDALAIAETAFERRGSSIDAEQTLALQLGGAGRLSDAVALLQPITDQLRNDDDLLALAAMAEALDAPVLRDEALAALSAAAGFISEFDDDRTSRFIRWYLAGAGLSGDTLEAVVGPYTSLHPDPVFGRLASIETRLMTDPESALGALLAFHDDRLRVMRYDLITTDLEERLFATLHRFRVAGLSAEVGALSERLATTRAFPLYLELSAIAVGDTTRGRDAWNRLLATSGASPSLRGRACRTAATVGESALTCFVLHTDAPVRDILAAALTNPDTAEREGLLEVADQRIRQSGRRDYRLRSRDHARESYAFALAAEWGDDAPHSWNDRETIRNFQDLYYAGQVEEAEAYIQAALAVSFSPDALAVSALAVVDSTADAGLAARLHAATVAANPMHAGDGAHSCAAGVVVERARRALRDGKARGVVAVSETHCGTLRHPELGLIVATEAALRGEMSEFPPDASASDLGWAANTLLDPPAWTHPMPELAADLATTVLRSPDPPVSAYAVRARARASIGDLEGAETDTLAWANATMALLEDGLPVLAALAAAGARSPAFDLADRIAAVPSIRDAPRGLDVAMSAFADGNAGMGLAWLAERRPDVLAAPEASGTEALLANLYELAGDPDSAIAALRVAQTRLPESPVILNNLAYLLANHGGDLAEAEALVRQALALDDEPSASSADTLGWILYLRGDLEEADHWITLALRLWPAYGSGDEGEAVLRAHQAEVRTALAEADDTADPLPSRRRGRRRR